MQIWLVLIFFRLEKPSNTIQSFYYSEPLAVNSPGISIVIKHLKIIKAKNTFPIRQHISRNTDKFSLWIFFLCSFHNKKRSEEAAADVPPQGREGWMYLSLLECSLAISLRFCLSHSRRALSCSSLCLFLRSCSRSFSFTLACFPWINRNQFPSVTAQNNHQKQNLGGETDGNYCCDLCCFIEGKILFWKGVGKPKVCKILHEYLY